MIHRLRDMIAPEGLATTDAAGRTVRFVPGPFRGGLLDRLADAWAVMTGAALAVKWPSPGDLERSLEWKL